MLQERAPGLWTLDQPDFKMGGIPIGTRTTLIRLADGGLFLHSPSGLTSERVKAITALGPVKHIVAPNLFHHLFVSENREAFPQARCYGAPGLAAKAGLSFDEELGPEAPAAWQGEIEQQFVPGAPRLNEVVFLHRASRTLLLTDLCFNVQHHESFLVRSMMKLTGVYGRFGPSRLARSFMKDKSAVRAAIDRVLEWDFDRVVVTHGEVLESGGREALREGFSAIR